MIEKTTQETYLKNARSLEVAFRKRGEKRSAQSFFDEIMKRSVKLRASSLRMYKRSAIYRLESIGDINEADKLRALLDDADITPIKKRRLVRRVPDDLVESILTVLDNRTTRIARKTRGLLLAMITTGLRPSEWENATLNGNMLTVKNAKFKTDLRANGEYRKLELLPTVTDQERDAIKRTIDLLHTARYKSQRPNISVEFKSALGEAIEKTKTTKWFYRLRIYDFRHQFSAEAKSAWGVGEGKVAAAMGHAVEDTAVQHYGRSKYGSGRTKVIPSSESIAKVRRLYEPMSKPPALSPRKPSGPAI